MSSPEAAARANATGAQFLTEIRAQPQALAGLLEHQSTYARVAAAARDRGASIVRMVGHGSSDNAASYGVYALGLLPRWTAMRDSITLTVYYDTDLEMRGSTVIGLSQSGRTPDVIEYVRRARGAGAFTVALTNDVGSDLAGEAEAVLPLAAGPERSVAATKTYLNQVAALGLFAAHAAGEGRRFAHGLRVVIDQLEELIPALERRVPPIALPFASVGRMFVIGRGTEFGTAREIALKLLETCRVAAEPLTATDLAHGPVAALDPLFPVWTIASEDETLPAVVEAAARARAAGATLVASGTAAAALDGAAYALPVPEPPEPLLSPLLSVVPGQLFASALAAAKGLDPDRPNGLSKVTLAR
ncbi:MAG TPA: SIS domain-containing protein [Gaiellaceae bacterium]|nr:SIS domain-containing protein [Gaiellaceae bacterium]